MTSKEMKLVKFEMIISSIAEKMSYTEDGYKVKCARLNPLKLLFGEEWDNEYERIVIENTFDKMYGNIFYEDWNDIKELIKVYNLKKKKWDNLIYNTGVQVVFFSLIILAIDNECYNEKLNILTDFAYLIGFDEEMISDWILAVKSILLMEKIDVSKMKSNNARNFFEKLA